MIQIQDLSFRYHKRYPLFEKLDLQLNPGNIYGLLGKNGAGKTTLLKILNGLLFPGGGYISIEGFHPADRKPSLLREIFLLTEEFALPSVLLESYLKYYSAFYPRFNHELFYECAFELKIPKSQKLSSMSYGQKKNFLLSFGLATDSRFLLLDEPTNGLDIPSKSKFRKLVANAIHEERSFIISTHQVRDMENLIDPIIVLDNGKVIFFEDYTSITEKLAFKKMSELPDDNEPIYSESSFGGHSVVMRNSEAEQTNINLELLFNAVISNTSVINEIFKSNHYEG